MDLPLHAENLAQKYITAHYLSCQLSFIAWTSLLAKFLFRIRVTIAEKESATSGYWRIYINSDME